MGWKVYGKRFETADAASTTIRQEVKFNNKNIILTKTRAWIVLTEDPTFTDMSMKVYSSTTPNAAGGEPDGLIATSTDSRTKAEFLPSDDNGIREGYWTFDSVSLKKGIYYFFVINMTGYTKSSQSEIMWKHSWPDPPYRTGISIDYEAIAISPYDLTFFGKEY